MARILEDIFPGGIKLKDLESTMPPPLPPDQQLRVAMSDAGITPPDDVILDGKLRRFSTSGKRGDDSGWYVGWDDGKGPAAGSFGDWRQGNEVTWRADIGREMSAVEQMMHAARMREAKQIRERELAEARQSAAETAAAIWEAAPIASDDHPYLLKKGIANPGLRVATDGRLIAPMYSGDALASLQFIAADGSKKFLKGGKAAGAWWLIGSLDNARGRVYVAEGVATAESIHAATGRPVAIAYSAGNMTATATALRGVVGPVMPMVVVADNDESGTGQREGQRAADAVGGVCMVSPYGDANDFVQEGGDLLEWLEGGMANDAPVEVASDRANVVPIREFMRDGVGISYVWQHILARGWLYALTANPGSGKTSVCLYMSVMMALGQPLMGKKTMPSRVLFLCGENPQDVRLRMEVMLLEMGLDVDVLDGKIYFTRRPFAIDDRIQMSKFVLEAVSHGPYDLMMIDTGPAHSSAEDENDNRAMHELAIAMRELMEPLGMPCTVALMHPHKTPTKESLLPRGGSAFVGSIDGCLCLWREPGEKTTELFPHGQKFRGRPFEPMYFDLMPINHPTALDNFGDPIGTVIAKPGEKTKGNPDDLFEALPDGVHEAMKKLEAAIDERGYRRDDGLPFVSSDAWNDYEEKHGQYATKDSRRQALSRARKKLKESGLMREVNGGYQVTEQAMSTVFVGCFMGLKSYGGRGFE